MILLSRFKEGKYGDFEVGAAGIANRSESILSRSL
jgi:hypothetical protein